MRQKLFLVLVTILGAAIFLMVIPGLAQSPLGVRGTAGTGFTYQGQLTDGGTPANGAYDFEFSLFDAATAGTQQGSTLTQNDVTVTDGLFSVTLDFGSGAFDGNARWLKVSVRAGNSTGTYTDLNPLTELTPAPYAIFSQSAPWSGLSGVPVGFSDGTDNDTLSGLTCANDEIAKWSGAAWQCGTDNTGSSTGAWSLTGNSGTTPGTNFIGTTDNVNLTLAVSGTTALQLMPNATSPNIVGGYGGNIVAAGVVGAIIGGGGNSSNFNRVTDDYGTIGGGMNNQAGDSAGTSSDRSWTTIGGGSGNVASGKQSTVSGGQYNTASSIFATVGGGDTNTAGGIAAFVGGGGYDGFFANGNQAMGTASVIGGGYGNVISATGDYATIGGGSDNVAGAAGATVGGGGNDGTISAGNHALGIASTIGGGYSNYVFDTAQYGTLSGGLSNYVNGAYATISGGGANYANADSSSVGGGYNNFITATAKYATISGGTNNTAQAITATIGGGEYISVSGQAATVSGGSHITATGSYAAVGGGYNNIAGGVGATVGGGTDNTVSDGGIGYATVGGGYKNTVSGNYSIIGGGNGNSVNGSYSAVSGGTGNSASGDYAAIPGGYKNIAGFISFAAGDTAHATHDGTFVWDGDISFPNSDLNSSATGQFIARAPGGFWFGSTTGNLTPTITNFLDTSTGAFLSIGGTWTNSSDRNLKENFTPVDNTAVLEAVAQLPISTWNYKAEPADIRHLGPMAQDFYAAFALGEDNTHISTVDEGGVALSAIQGLYAQNKQLQAENDALQSRLDALETRMSALERDRSTPVQSGWLPGFGGLLMIAGIMWVTRRKGETP